MRYYCMLRILFSILLCLIPFLAMAREWTGATIPMVHLSDGNRYVCDPDGILSQEMRDSADVYLKRLDKECGIESVLVIVDNVQGADAFRVCQDIFDKYGVGDAKTRRGIVITIAVEDRKYFIMPGYGLEQDLTDIESDDIGRACIARNMRLNNPDAAVLSTVKALYSKFKTGKTGLAEESGGDIDAASAILILCVIFFVVAMIIDNHRNGGGGHRGGNGGGPFIIWGNPGHIGDSDFGHGGFGGFGGGFGGGGAGGAGAGGGW